jgi:hypothetical protein
MVGKGVPGKVPKSVRASAPADLKGYVTDLEISEQFPLFSRNRPARPGEAHPARPCHDRTRRALLAFAGLPRLLVPRTPRKPFKGSLIRSTISPLVESTLFFCHHSTWVTQQNRYCVEQERISLKAM